MTTTTQQGVIHAIERGVSPIACEGGPAVTLVVDLDYSNSELDDHHTATYDGSRITILRDGDKLGSFVPGESITLRGHLRMTASRWLDEWYMDNTPRRKVN